MITSADTRHTEVTATNSIESMPHTHIAHSKYQGEWDGGTARGGDAGRADGPGREYRWGTRTSARTHACMHASSCAHAGHPRFHRQVYNLS